VDALHLHEADTATVRFFFYNLQIKAATATNRSFAGQLSAAMMYSPNFIV
jgi:hypothetical protein